MEDKFPEDKFLKDDNRALVNAVINDKLPSRARECTWGIPIIKRTLDIILFLTSMRCLMGGAKDQVCSSNNCYIKFLRCCCCILY